MKKKTRALIDLNIATFMLGGNALFAKLISLPATLIILGRTVFASITLLVFILLFKNSLKLKRTKDYFIIIGLGILVSIHWVSFFYSAQISTVAVAMISLFTFPIMTTFLEPYFFKEKLHLSDIITAAFVLGGIVLIVPEFNINNNITQGVLLGLISALTYSFRNIFTKKHFSNYASSVVMFYQVLVVGISLIPFLFFQELKLQENDLIYLVILGVFLTGVGHTLFVRSLTVLKAKTASIITSVQPIYAIIFAAIILNEIPSTKVLIGGVIILAAVIAETLKFKKPETTENGSI